MYDLMLFILLYLVSFHLVMNSDDWFMVWVGLEINMMMFIIVVFKRYSMLNLELCLKYFFIQSLGSSVFLVMLYIQNENLDIILCMVMGYKIGAGPFYFWFPMMCNSMSWMSCFILMLFQKIIPLLLMSIFISWIIFLMAFVSLIMGVFGSFNQLSLKKLMAYSSIYHLGWILMCMSSNSLNWIIYLMMYGIMIQPVLFFFMSNDLENLIMIMKKKEKVGLIVLMLSMAGMPPFLGFFIKWFAFSMIIDMGFYITIILIISSVVMFYVYFRIIIDILMGYWNLSSWELYKINNKNKIFMDLVISFGILFGIFISFYLLF